VSPAPLPAQTVSGTILRRIQNQKGAAIPKADVSAKNVETGALRNTVADESGNYRDPGVPVAYNWSKSIDDGSTAGNDGSESANTTGAPWAFDPRINLEAREGLHWCVGVIGMIC
jgi:hypothetical protein